MKFLHYLIVVPLLAVAVWAICTADPNLGSEVKRGILFSWYKDATFNTKSILVVFLVYGYIIGRIDAWFGYSPLRRDLRRQKKENKALNKEQAKLNETVSDLKQDIASLQEKAKQDTENQVSEKKNEIKAWWNGFKQKITTKKGN